MSWPAAVLWDMDGTLIDSQHVWDTSLAELARHLGGHLSADTLAAVVGWTADAVVSKLFADLGLIAEPTALLDAEHWFVNRVEETFRREVAWLPGAREALSQVQKVGLPMALVTSTRRSVTNVVLDTMGAGLFDVTVCGDEVDGRNKPDPEPYLRAARLLGVVPAECVAIEDSPTGVSSAVAAGCVVLVVSGAAVVPPGRRRLFRASLVDFDIAELMTLRCQQAL